MKPSDIDDARAVAWSQGGPPAEEPCRFIEWRIPGLAPRHVDRILEACLRAEALPACCPTRWPDRPDLWCTPCRARKKAR